METIQPWKLISKTLVLCCSPFNVARAVMQAPASMKHMTREYYWLETGDWVNVIALTPEDDILLIRQYRHGSGTLTLEMPGGRIDPGEDAAAAAARELREETGYEAATLRKLGALRPNPAIMNNRAHTFLAEGCTRAGEICNDEGEETRLVKIPAREISERIARGEIDHALMVAALHLWENPHDPQGRGGENPS